MASVGLASPAVEVIATDARATMIVLPALALRDEVAVGT